MPHSAIPETAAPNPFDPTYSNAPNAVATAKYPADYLFVNNVRFLSMAAVVACHCIGAAWSVAGTSSLNWLLSGMLQPLKFGTIAFFLISGFLMNEGITRGGALQYLARRLKRVFTPWLVWFSLFYGMLLAKHLMKGDLSLSPLRSNLPYLLGRLHDCLFFTAFWFVPNLLIALCVLLLCRRFLCDLRFGCLLLAISLFYGFNTYAQWFSLSSHSEALFGFVFYLWLGAWGARNVNAVSSLVARISMPALITLAVITGMAALCESHVLASRGSLDVMDTLRISNQAYSVVMVLAILKLHKAASPRTWDVRASTFGIYLTHSLILALLMGISGTIVAKASADQAWYATIGRVICLSVGSFAATYGCSLLLTRSLLNRPGLRWLVGGAAAGRRAAARVGSTNSLSLLQIKVRPTS